MSRPMRRFGIAIAGLLFLLLGLIEVSGGARLNPAVPPAVSSAEAVFASTAKVYVGLRAVNAVLSTAQEVEVGASVGAQANTQPLKFLEPVDDTVERVAEVVFAVAAGAMLASVGVGPVASLGLLVLGAGLLVGAAAGARPELEAIGPAGWRAVRLGAALAFFVPIGLAGGTWLGERLTAPSWEAAVANFERVTGQAEDLVNPAEEAGPGGLTVPEAEWSFGKLRRGLGSTLEAIGEYRRVDWDIWKEADTLIRASMTIIAVYAVQVLVLPALLLWGMLAVLRRLS